MYENIFLSDFRKLTLILIFKMEPTRTYFVALAALLDVEWQPGWEGSLGEDGYLQLSHLAIHLKLSQHC